MRLLHVLKNDIRYQARYGFYLIYLLLTIVYILILKQINDPVIKAMAGTLVILSDPAVLGYFFIGGIWLLEKEEGLHSYVAIAPMKTSEYVLSKIISLGIVSTCSATFIAGITMPWINLFALVGIVFLSSCFFTLIGLLLATFAKTVNGYLMISVPPALLLLTPSVLSVFGIQLPFTSVIPGTLVFNLISNTLNNHAQPILFSFIGLLFWTVFLFAVVLRFVGREIGALRGKNYAFHA